MVHRLKFWERHYLVTFFEPLFNSATISNSIMISCIMFMILDLCQSNYTISIGNIFYLISLSVYVYSYVSGYFEIIVTAMSISSIISSDGQECELLCTMFHLLPFTHCPTKPKHISQIISISIPLLSFSKGTLPSCLILIPISIYDISINGIAHILMPQQQSLGGIFKGITKLIYPKHESIHQIHQQAQSIHETQWQYEAPKLKLSNACHA